MSATVTFAEAIRLATVQEMERNGEVFAFGEGINDPAGFFGTTVGLAERFGPDRCFDVPNSEETLAGFALGAALGGLRPVFVNLRVEFLLLAMNQLINHAAKWPALVGREVSLPLTVRAMVGRGWGQGAQHSGFYGPLFAHVPGLDVAVASGPVEGAGLLVSALRADVPTILIEPKAVFETVSARPTEFTDVPRGRAAVLRPGRDFTLVSLGDGVQTALVVAEDLAARGVDVGVVDLRWLSPFDGETVSRAVAATRRVGVLDIGWESFGVAAEVARCLVTQGVRLEHPMLSWAPLGHAPAGCFAESTHYPDPGGIVRAVLSCVGEVSR